MSTQPEKDGGGGVQSSCLESEIFQDPKSISYTKGFGAKLHRVVPPPPPRTQYAFSLPCNGLSSPVLNSASCMLDLTSIPFLETSTTGT